MVRAAPSKVCAYTLLGPHRAYGRANVVSLRKRLACGALAPYLGSDSTNPGTLKASIEQADKRSMASSSDKPETTLTADLCKTTGGVSRETEATRWITDQGLCLATGAQTLDLYSRLAARVPGVKEWVPADGCLLAVLEPGADIPAGLFDLLSDPGVAERSPRIEHVIPVHFDGEDLSLVAEYVGDTCEGLIACLSALNLRVKFLGFQPGFAYLEGLPAELHLPRRATPRKQVPAGSVALGGGYCGIYPAAGPGGWHLLGTTHLALFDPSASPPARLQPGDSVRLVVA